jgi:methionine-rich copper-binding protein CopC
MAPRICLALIALVVLLGGAGEGSAHAFLDHADPRVGSTIKTPPAQVRLWFTQQLEPAFSTMRVLDAAGKQVDKQDVKVDASKPDLLTVSVPSLGPGTYKVVWRVLSVDTHVTEGDFTFTIAR